MFNLFLYAASVLIWGSTWYAIEFQLGVVAIEVSLTYRFLISAALAFAWCGLRRDSVSFSWSIHRYFLLLGLFLFGLNYIAAYSAQIYITSALNAIGFSTMVWMNILNARIFFGRPIEPRTYAGAGLGMSGIIALFWPEVRDISLQDGVFIGIGFSLLGAFLASLGNTVSLAVQQKKIPVMQTNAWGMLYGGLFNGGLALLQGRTFNFDSSPEYIISLLFLAIFGSLVAFACYLTLLGKIGMERAGYIVVIIPIVALVISALFEGLTLDLHILIGITLALLGNIIILGRQVIRKSIRI